MAYELTYSDFTKKIKDPDLKKALAALKLPDSAFFGSPDWKAGMRVSFNAHAKTSEENIKFLETKFNTKSVGLNLDVTVSGATVRFIKSSKKASSSRNALGKALADAGELATVMSLTKDIVTPADTGQKIFIDDVDAFTAWIPTFKHTRTAIESIVGRLNTYDILHDATDRSEFKDVIDSFCKKIKTPKDSWNPADIFIIKTNKKNHVINALKDIVDTYDVKEGLAQMFNNKIYEFYKEKLLYPISLKQLTSSKATIEYTNEPGRSAAADYNITINNINCNLSATGKEIGLFTFKNNDTNKIISLQVRGFPHGYGTAQCEITSDGTPTGGRLGKISAVIVDKVLSEFDFERISSIAYFGRAPNTFSEFDEARINEVYSWYKAVIKHSKVNDVNPLTLGEFKTLVKKARSDYDIAENLCQKIQGLKMMYFFVLHEKDLSVIMNKMISGAKKVSSDNGFFIKIY